MCSFASQDCFCIAVFDDRCMDLSCCAPEAWNSLGERQIRFVPIIACLIAKFQNFAFMIVLVNMCVLFVSTLLVSNYCWHHSMWCKIKQAALVFFIQNTFGNRCDLSYEPSCAVPCICKYIVVTSIMVTRLHVNVFG